jgi:hypothetical protein
MEQNALVLSLCRIANYYLDGLSVDTVGDYKRLYRLSIKFQPIRIFGHGLACGRQRSCICMSLRSEILSYWSLWASEVA